MLVRMDEPDLSLLRGVDAFRAIVLAFIVVPLVVPFMRKVASPAAPSADGHWE
jgi:hypothetical protein